LGVEDCLLGGNERATNSVKINVGVSAEIIQQPTDLFVCVGDAITTELFTILTEPYLESFPNIYR
jgi:uncharacterized protein (UPF0218 family)